MLVYTPPSYDYYSRTPLTLYRLPHYVPARTTSPRERYIRAVAELQSARETYLYEIEEQRFLDSLRQQEALRHYETLRQTELRHRQAQNFLARRRASRPSIGCHCQPSVLDPSVQPRSFPKQQRVHFTGIQHQGQLRAVEDLLKALIGVGAEHGNEDKPGENPQEKVRAKHGRESATCGNPECFVTKLEAIREKAQSGRDPHAQRAQPASESSSHIRGQGQTTSPLGAQESSSPVPAEPEVSAIRNSRDRAACTIQRHWRSHSVDAAAREDALATIEVLRTRFQFLRDTFSFPEHLEFRPQEPGRDGNAEAPALSYSSTNAGVHTYTNELTKLLMNADAVPARGNKRVRGVRRTFVRDVEEQLQMVEARVKNIWEKRAEGAVTEHEKESKTRQHEDTVDAEASTITIESPSELGTAPNSITSPGVPKDPFASQATSSTSSFEGRSKSEEEPHAEHHSEDESSIHRQTGGVSHPGEDTDQAGPAMEEPSAVEFVEIEHSDVTDPVGNTDAEVPEDDFLNHQNTYSPGSTPSSSSEDSQTIASARLESPPSEASLQELTIDLNTPTHSDAAPDSPSASEPFNDVHPDPQPAPPATPESDFGVVDSDKELPVRTIDQPAHEEEGFELL